MAVVARVEGGKVGVVREEGVMATARPVAAVRMGGAGPVAAMAAAEMAAAAMAEAVKEVAATAADVKAANLVAAMVEVVEASQ